MILIFLPRNVSLRNMHFVPNVIYKMMSSINSYCYKYKLTALSVALWMSNINVCGLKLL